MLLLAWMQMLAFVHQRLVHSILSTTTYLPYSTPVSFASIGLAYRPLRPPSTIPSSNLLNLKLLAFPQTPLTAASTLTANLTLDPFPHKTPDASSV